MPLITVGVPAYNESELLEKSLEALRVQTFTDFEVLIFDNASTDTTPEIAARLASCDPRFRHIRQPYNKGEFRNYYEAVQAASSPYFMWRACDDRCDPNYLEELAGLLQSHPDKDLAVGRVRMQDMDGGRQKLFEFPNFYGGPTWVNRTRYLLNARAGWYYGLYRHTAIRKQMDKVVQTYKNLWGFDYLVLLGFLLDDKVIGSTATTFVQMRKRTRETARKKRSDKERDRLIYLHRRFLEVARGMLSERVSSRATRLAYEPVLFAFTGRKLVRYRRLVWRKLTRPSREALSQFDDLDQV